MNTRPQGLVHHFGGFTLDEGEKQLWRGDERVPVNPRYFDALLLLARNPDALITKDRFFDEVWSGVTVGDEALTQCIKSLRKALGDPHGDPRFIATVPKHGYRFIARVETVAPLAPPPTAESVAAATPTTMSAIAGDRFGRPLRMVVAGTLGGGTAGLVGGVIYGLAAVGGGGGAASILFVLTAMTITVGILGALGVTLGMAIASIILRREWVFSIVGSAAGGLFVGTVFNILGTDSLHLLFGSAPDHITGGLEGAVLGAALAAGARAGGGLTASGWRPAFAAAASSAIGGIGISLCGGKLMGGSLNALASSFHASRLELDAIGRLAGEVRFGPIAQALAAGMEGFLFGFGVVGAMLVWRRLGQQQPALPS